MDWKDAANGALGGGLVATVVQWLLGRTETAQQKREKEIRRVTEGVLDDQKIGDRIVRLEAILPLVHEDIKDTKELARSTNETLNALAIAGRIHIRKED